MTTITQPAQSTRQTINHPISKPVKAAPARHRLTRTTLPQFRASYLIKGVSPRTRRGRA
jgi:hypothetical protein